MSILTDAFREAANVRYFSAGMPANCQVVENNDGTAVVKGLPVFRTGTFRDSMGIQRTWTADHLAQMVFHYNMLKNNNTFPNVPVRSDHSISADKVAGYHDNLTISPGAGPDGTDLLCSDFSFTEPDAYAKFKRGTYRSRSAEVGMYETNDDALYFPVFMGFAFVDIPAVEGLHSRNTTVDGKAFVLFDKEIPHVTTDHKFRVRGTEVTDFAAVQAYIDALEAAGTQVATFRVNGADTTDVNAVQAHIVTLETVVSESTKATRESFVKKLVADHKIGQPQEASFLKLVNGDDASKGMTDEQFDQFAESYKNAPAMPLFGKFTEGVQNANGDGADPIADEIALNERIVLGLKRSGMTDEQITASKPAQRLVALRATQKN